MGRKVYAGKIREEKLKEKRRLAEPKFFRICPKCGSTKVAISKAKQQQELPSQYKCRKCGYTSYFFQETTKERLKKRPRLVLRLRKRAPYKAKKKRKMR